MLRSLRAHSMSIDTYRALMSLVADTTTTAAKARRGSVATEAGLGSQEAAAAVTGALRPAPPPRQRSRSRSIASDATSTSATSTPSAAGSASTTSTTTTTTVRTNLVAVVWTLMVHNASPYVQLCALRQWSDLLLATGGYQVPAAFQSHR